MAPMPVGKVWDSRNHVHELEHEVAPTLGLTGLAGLA